MTARGRVDQTGIGERRRSSTVVVALLFLTFASLAANHWWNRQPIEHVVTDGTTSLSDASVRAVLMTVHGKKVRDVVLAELRDSVERIPFVRSAIVYFDGVRGVEALVDERTPVAHIVMANGSLRYVDADGVLLPPTSTVVPAALPLVRPDSLSHLPALIRVVNDARSVLSPQLFASISEFVERPGGDVHMIADNMTWRIGVPDGKRCRDSFADMNIFWDQAMRTGVLPKAAEVDLRWRNQVVIRTHTAAATSGEGAAS